MEFLDILTATALGGATAIAVGGGLHMFIHGERLRRRRINLENLALDAYPFNADTPSVICGGCGQSVATAPDGFTIAGHDCPYAKQPDMFDAVTPAYPDPKKIPIGYTGHLHQFK
jgi:hypothetical protein